MIRSWSRVDFIKDGKGKVGGLRDLTGSRAKGVRPSSAKRDRVVIRDRRFLHTGGGVTFQKTCRTRSGGDCYESVGEPRERKILILKEASNDPRHIDGKKRG